MDVVEARAIYGLRLRMSEEVRGQLTEVAWLRNAKVLVLLVDGFVERMSNEVSYH